MSFRRFLSLGSAALSVSMLAIGYAQDSILLSAGAVFITLPLWVLASKKTSGWLPDFALVTSSVVASIGVYIGTSPYFMILTAVFGLAGWDLINLDHNLTNTSNPDLSKLVEQKHFHSLLLALGAGGSLALLGLTVQFQIPFGLLLLMIIAIFLSFDRIWHKLK
jgi:hypothetical protein